MKRILVDVDTQFDFMEEDGSLYVPTDLRTYGRIAGILADESYDAVIGSVDSHAYDAWEFKENGGPFPPHCVKGTPGWLRVFGNYPKKQRFVPMIHVQRDMRGPVHTPFLLVGENSQGAGSRLLTPADLAKEAIEGKVGMYFEKEVYSLFKNPMADLVLLEIGNLLGGDWTKITIDVIGYATGGYCVDAAVEGLRSHFPQVPIRVLSYATAAIGGADGMAKSKAALTELGAEWVENP